MNTFVDQSLIDSGDPLALQLIAEGSEVCRLKPVSEWTYDIYKVKYYRGNIDEPVEKSTLILEGYVLSSESHIEGDADRHGPSCDWMCWEAVEEGLKAPTFQGTYGFRQSYGYGRYDSVKTLKVDYRI